MAHYDITHACGHDERIELFGKTSERERRIEWLQERPCTECWKKERAAEAEARKNKEAAMIVEKLGDEAADAVNALSNASCTLAHIICSFDLMGMGISVLPCVPAPW